MVYQRRNPNAGNQHSPKLLQALQEDFRNDRYRYDGSGRILENLQAWCVAIPSNRGLQRIEFPDAIYLTEQEKFNAIAEEVERVNKFDTIFFQDKKRGYLIGNINQNQNRSCSKEI